MGTQGHLYNIIEPDLLLMLTERLNVWQASGKLDDLQRQLIQQTEQRLKRPIAVTGLQRTVVGRRWRYDPSLTLERELTDQHGQVFYHKGTQFNPLHYQQLTIPLVLFNADDPAQVTWIEQHYITAKQPAKLILVKGAPFKLMKRWEQPLFFDQSGVLTRKFNIKSVPARISQPAGQTNYLLVEEVICQPVAQKNLLQESSQP